MTASVLLARIALSALATTLAALAAERALRDVGRPGRVVWLLALVVTGASSVLLVAGGRLPLAAPAAVSAWLDPAAGLAVWVPSTSDATATTSPLPLAWLVLSIAVLGVLALTLLRQRRRLCAQPTARVSGRDVVVTRALGPAVFGVLHPRIVVPHWLLERPEAERRLVVEHEAEHIAARDPLLAAAALLVVCLVPWNPLLWYQLRRLRLAIEIDCDARVLLNGDALAYGRLLVDVADRLARGTPLATALAFPRNFLEWRIRMIVNRRNRPLRAAAWTLAAGALVVAACADAADPLASEVEEVEFVAVPDIDGAVIEADLDMRSGGDEVEFVATEIPVDESAAEGGVLLLDTPAREGGMAEPAPGDLMRAGELRVSQREHIAVPFRVELGPDDRPTSFEFDASIPADRRERAEATLGTFRFRRSATDPNAPVEGVVVLD